jgi:hypothetical protein
LPGGVSGHDEVIAGAQRFHGGARSVTGEVLAMKAQIRTTAQPRCSTIAYTTADEGHG